MCRAAIPRRMKQARRPKEKKGNIQKLHFLDVFLSPV
jgi:hypothetical protein